jgi:hypothetical protein
VLEIPGQPRATPSPPPTWALLPWCVSAGRLMGRAPVSKWASPGSTDRQIGQNWSELGNLTLRGSRWWLFVFS